MEKFNPSYVGARPDVLKLIPSHLKSILDVGCSTGVLGKSVKKKTGGKVFGIELSKKMAEKASKHLDKVYVGDVKTIMGDGSLKGKKFDAIIFADVLEHLEDPWAVLSEASKYLSKEGFIIVSLPNIRHISTISNLLFRGYWPYRNRGIHDRTHLRFFTKKNMIELFENADMEIQSIDANYRLFEKPHRINRFAKFIAIPGIKDFFVFQYLIRAKTCKR